VVRRTSKIYEETPDLDVDWLRSQQKELAISAKSHCFERVGSVEVKVDDDDHYSQNLEWRLIVLV
jgi:hypothetical protein